MSAVDRDLDPDAPTIFELCEESLAALSVISRGLHKTRRIGAITARSAFRAATTHFRGNVAGWLDIDRDVADQVVDRVRTDRPAFTFAALTGVDKVSHSRGHESSTVLDALRIVDDTAARIRADAERDGRWKDMSLWIVSDHGHSRVSHHEDLAALIESAGFRTMSHPWVYNIAPEVAVMVSGNAMAHLYLDVTERPRARPTARDAHFRSLVPMLLQRPSVDLLIMPAHESAIVHTRDRGIATVWRDAQGYHYRRVSGDPLGLGADLANASMNDAYDATLESDYPDGIVQILHLATAPRSGEIILSASRDWDFRARYEPIPHISSHGALHREHMLVPLLVNHPVKREPRRTVDVMPSALAALGLPVPPGLDGESFL
jgi:arylsulfatase A-like enzyme